MIPVSDRRSPVYTGTGAVSAYDFAFKIFTDGDVAVVVADTDGVETTFVLDTDYTVSVNADQTTFPGGTVNLTAPLALGHTLVVLGDLDYSQTTQLPNGGNYNARVVEQALDKLAVQIQQLREVVNRSVTLAPTSDDVSTALPLAEPASVIGWNNTGDALQNYDAGQLGVAVSYANWRTDTFNGTGAQTEFVLAVDAGSASNIDLRVGDVPQTPGLDFSYAPGTKTITFLTGAPGAGTDNVVARYGQALPQGTIAAGAVTSTELADGAVTTSKIGDAQVATGKLTDRAVTAAKLPASTTARLWGRITAGSGDVEQLTGAQAQSMLPVQQSRIDVASASTVNLTSSAPNSDHINITGTTTITGFTVAAGRLVFVRFNASLTLTNGAGLVTQTGANIVTQAGDTCVLRATAADTVEVMAYVPAVLNQQTVRSIVRVYGSAATPSINSAIRRFTTVHANIGGDITYADSASLGASFTINKTGMYLISYTDYYASGGINLGVSVNSSQLTTDIASITSADRLTFTTSGAAGVAANCCVPALLQAGDVVRPHSNPAVNGSQATFTIARFA